MIGIHLPALAFTDQLFAPSSFASSLSGPGRCFNETLKSPTHRLKLGTLARLVGYADVRPGGPLIP